MFKKRFTETVGSKDWNTFRSVSTIPGPRKRQRAPSSDEAQAHVNPWRYSPMKEFLSLETLEIATDDGYCRRIFVVAIADVLDTCIYLDVNMI